MAADYMSMMGYGSGYQPMAPLELTQPAPLPSWMPAPVQRTFPMAMPSGPVAAPVAEGVGSGGFLGGGMFSGGFGASESVPGYTVPTLGAGPTSSGGGWSWLNTRDQQGVLGPALAGAQALGNLFMGMKQYGIAKDQLAFQKDSFNKQYAANQSMTNSRLEDRQARRVLENPNAMGVAEYMSKWGVK